MQYVISSGKSIDDALLDGFGLRIKTWGGFAALVMDQVNFDYIPGKPNENGQCPPLFSIRDSSLDLCLDFRSKGSFFSTLGNLISGSFNTTLLSPKVMAPLSGELNIDVEVSNNVTVSPM